MDKKTTMQLQELLQALGHSPGPIDGIEGIKTTSAIAAAYAHYVGAKIEPGATATPVQTDLSRYLQADGFYHFPKGENIQVSRNFHLREFDCQCRRPECKETVLHPQLVDDCQTLRDRAGVPLGVNSGYRCGPHNIEVGGAQGSLHTLGLAADLSGADVDRLAALADPDSGEIGKYPGWIHLGVFRPDGRKTRWDNR